MLLSESDIGHKALMPYINNPRSHSLAKSDEESKAYEMNAHAIGIKAALIEEPTLSTCPLFIILVVSVVWAACSPVPRHADQPGLSSVSLWETA